MFLAFVHFINTAYYVYLSLHNHKLPSHLKIFIFTKYSVNFISLSLLTWLNLDWLPPYLLYSYVLRFPLFPLNWISCFLYSMTSSWFIPSFWWSASCRSILRRDIGSKRFETWMSENAFFLLSHLIGSLTGYKILGCELFSFRILCYSVVF